ncbi:MAG: hypothetical protein M1561_00020 [Gammaproteobacteria bacterium]|nr:hypothetical protein [Gammaproteobacteria bacterium]
MSTMATALPKQQSDLDRSLLQDKNQEQERSPENPPEKCSKRISKPIASVIDAYNNFFKSSSLANAAATLLKGDSTETYLENKKIVAGCTWGGAIVIDDLIQLLHCLYPDNKRLQSLDTASRGLSKAASAFTAYTSMLSRVITLAEIGPKRIAEGDYIISAWDFVGKFVVPATVITGAYVYLEYFTDANSRIKFYLRVACRNAAIAFFLINGLCDTFAPNIQSILWHYLGIPLAAALGGFFLQPLFTSAVDFLFPHNDLFPGLRPPKDQLANTERSFGSNMFFSTATGLNILTILITLGAPVVVIEAYLAWFFSGTVARILAHYFSGEEAPSTQISDDADGSVALAKGNGEMLEIVVDRSNPIPPGAIVPVAIDYKVSQNQAGFFYTAASSSAVSNSANANANAAALPPPDNEFKLMANTV